MADPESELPKNQPLTPPTPKPAEPSAFAKRTVSLQYSFWNAILVLSALAVACFAFSLLKILGLMLKDIASVLTRLAQAMQFAELVAPKTSGSEALQVLSRNLLAWTILPHIPNDWLSITLMLTWALGEVVRCNYRIKPSKLAAHLKHNLLLATGPLSLGLELAAVVDSFWIGGLRFWWLKPWTVAPVLLLMLCEFKGNFGQVLAKRRLFYAKKVTEDAPPV